MEFFSLLEFANLAGLALGLASPLLVLAYLKRRPQQRKVFSSLVLLKALPRKKSVKRRVKIPPTFFLELLALLLLALAFASPFLRRGGEQVAVLFDNSLSMRARGDSDSRSRLELALVQLDSRVNEYAGSTKYSLFSSSPRLTRVGPEQMSSAELLSNAENIEASFSSDQLGLAAAELAKSARYNEVLVVSDRSVQFEELEPQSKLDGESTEIEHVLVGPSASNIYLLDFRFERGAVGRKERSLLAWAGLSGSLAQKVDAYLRDNSSGTLIAQKDFTLKPGQVSEVRFEVPGSRAALKTYSLEIKARNKAFHDAIAEDNQAWASKARGAKSDVLLVSTESRTRDALGLRLISGLAVKQISVEQYASLNLPDLQDYSLIIFHKVVPRTLPKVSSLFVLPPAGQKFFPVLSEESNVTITSWKEEHPITSYLRVPLLQPSGSLVFQAPLWTQEVLRVEKGPVLLAGESGGLRFSALGFEILPFEGRGNPPTTILTLNLMNWLRAGSEIGNSLRTGSVYQLEAGKTWLVKSPQGDIRTIEPSAENPEKLSFDQAGVYILTSISGQSQENLKRTHQLFTANLNHPDESATFEEQFFVVKKRFSHDELSHNTERPLWPLLVKLAFALLCFELIWRIFRIRTGRASEG